MVWIMRNKTNLKIYALILGIIAGTIIYNIFRIDFSFSMIKVIEIKDIILEIRFAQILRKIHVKDRKII